MASNSRHSYIAIDSTMASNSRHSYIAIDSTMASNSRHKAQKCNWLSMRAKQNNKQTKS